MRNSLGFTLIELMITIAILAILAGVAIPGYIGWLPKRHLQSSALDVQAAINSAKIVAIRENTKVVLTFDPGNDSYLAFIDNNNDGVTDPTDENGSPDAGERTIRSKRMSPGINLVSTNFGDKLTFDSRGLLPAGGGDIILRNNRNEDRTINVTITGMSRIN